MMGRRISTTLVWLGIVFASGLTMGVVAHRYFVKETVAQVQPEKPSRDQLRQDYLTKMRNRVGVNEDQIAKIVEVLDRARLNADARKDQFDHDMRQMQRGVRSEIRGVLTDEQRARYDEWREERMRKRKAEQKNNKGE